jgi:hypothetical protein
MNRLNENSLNTDLYARVQRTPMSERDRQVALNALRNAESIVDGCVWIVDGVRGLIARIFEKPAGLKHSH